MQAANLSREELKMWVSSKEWAKLMKRIEALEEGQGVAASDEGYFYASRYAYYGKRVKVSEIVTRLANHLGLRYVPESGPSLEFEDRPDAAQSPSTKGE